MDVIFVEFLFDLFHISWWTKKKKKETKLKEEHIFFGTKGFNALTGIRLHISAVSVT